MTDFKRTTQCPCCGSCLDILLKEPGIESVRATNKEPAEGWKKGLSDIELEICERADKLGLINSLALAAREQGTPVGSKNIKPFFLKLLKVAKPIYAPGAVVESLEKDCGGVIQINAANGIGMVLSDGVLKMFVPMRYLANYRVDDIKVGETTASLKSSLGEWVRTKMGYVPASAGLFLAEMRRKNKGSFSNV